MVRELHCRSPHAAALVLTASRDIKKTARAVEAGAAGALHKSVGVQEIIRAIRRVSAGETLSSQGVIIELLRLASRHRELDREAPEVQQEQGHL